MDTIGCKFMAQSHLLVSESSYDHRVMRITAPPSAAAGASKTEDVNTIKNKNKMKQDQFVVAWTERLASVRSEAASENIKYLQIKNKNIKKNKNRDEQRQSKKQFDETIPRALPLSPSILPSILPSISPFIPSESPSISGPLSAPAPPTGEVGMTAEGRGMKGRAEALSLWSPSPSPSPSPSATRGRGICLSRDRSPAQQSSSPAGASRCAVGTADKREAERGLQWVYGACLLEGPSSRSLKSLKIFFLLFLCLLFTTARASKGMIENRTFP